jgi:hypothetical protein
MEARFWLLDYVRIEELFVLKAVCINKVLALYTGDPVHKFHGQIVLNMGVLFGVYRNDAIGIHQFFVAMTKDIQF